MTDPQPLTDNELAQVREKYYDAHATCDARRLLATVDVTRAERDALRTAIVTALDDSHRGFGGGITPAGEAVLRAALDSTSEADLPAGVRRDGPGWVLGAGNPMPEGWEPDGWDPWWTGEITGKAMGVAQRIRPALDSTSEADPELPPGVVRKGDGLVLRADRTLWNPDDEWEMQMRDGTWVGVGERYCASAGRDVPVRRRRRAGQ